MASQGNIDNFNIRMLNNFCKNKKGVYELLSSSLGLFLPKFESRAVTEQYLMKALKKEIFLMERKDMRPAPSLKEKVSCSDLFDEISKILAGKNLGFDYNNLPDKQYLCDVLFSLKNDHPFFTINSEFNVSRQLDEKYLLKF